MTNFPNLWFMAINIILPLAVSVFVVATVAEICMRTWLTFTEIFLKKTK